ncbi:ATP-binding protein [Calorimonas adulescens]|jgi:hypothetical protein|uniref:Ferredoxin n=1 Tax=Calorimonas adulescens TaxID=2606906 RepID=A0A5D8Q8H1_9THEO|nr:4Fe-4S binding protein [Calorimonas adulescens]TZE81065.1 ferredoxin [Calorimonas adulescens]
MALRKIIKIDEDKCNGCGECITPCIEGALILENGKAKVIKEEFCDGGGVCLAFCPTGALTIEEREAEEFNKGAVNEYYGDDNKREETCIFCGNSEYEAAIIDFRFQGIKRHVCVKCLPRLIHG